LKQEALYSRFKRTIALLCLAIVVLWILFYAVVRRSVENNAIDTVEQVSENVILSLEDRFLIIENMSYTLSNEPELIQMLKAKSILAFYDEAAKAATQVEAVAKADPAVSNILLYDQSGNYYRFLGKMSNTVLGRLFKTISGKSLPINLSCTSDGMNYIGYASGIYEDGTQLGSIAMLLEETEIKRIFDAYDQMPYLGIALLAEGRVVYTNRNNLSETEILKETQSALFRTNKKIGLTPFSVLVFYDNSQSDKLSGIFSVIILVTIIFLFVIVVRFLRFWQKHFFRPIGGIIREVEQFNADSNRTLGMTGEVYYDGLVTEINKMLQRIDDNEAELIRSRELLYHTELQKQKELVVSLKKQINAHFTVNSLNTIRALIKNKQNDKAEEICNGLSGLLQYANAGDEYITVLDEFSMLERYIAIMHTRYPKRFTAELEFDDDIAELKIPRMLLQPIVENAILHGFQTKDGGTLLISCKICGKTLCLSVSDQGCGMDFLTLTALRERLQSYINDDMIEGLSHVALPNIQKRIQTSFGREFGIAIESEPNRGTTVLLKLPQIE